MGSRASWGSVRKLPSGRYQARYRVDGKMVAAPTTFRTKRDAEAYLSTVRADMERGTWVNPAAGKVTLRAYATRWLEQRPDLRPRTVELYEGELRLHILPVLGDLELAKITPGEGAGLARGAAQGRQARSHDGGEVLPAAARHPEHRGRRRAARAEPVRHQGRRPGEGARAADRLDPAGVRDRRHDRAAVPGDGAHRRVRRAAPRRDAGAHAASAIDLRARPDQGGRAVPGAQGRHRTSSARRSPTPASARSPSPRCSSPELEAHLATYAAPGKKGLVFCGPNGQPLRRASWYTAWNRAMTELGIEGMKPHDLRHTGNTLAAMTGASTEGADGEVRPVDLTSGADLPARHPGPRPRDRRRPQRPDRGEAQATPDLDSSARRRHTIYVANVIALTSLTSTYAHRPGSGRFDAPRTAVTNHD